MLFYCGMQMSGGKPTDTEELTGKPPRLSAGGDTVDILDLIALVIDALKLVVDFIALLLSCKK